MCIRDKLIQLGIDKLSSNDLERFSREILQEKYDEYIEIGEFDTSYSVEGVGRFRINVFKEKNNDAIAIRVIALKIPTLNELNHPEVLKSIINKKRGLILVTGPTGSGKSTTLACLLYTSSIRKRGTSLISSYRNNEKRRF